LLDSGNFTDTPTPQGITKTRALLTAMETLGYSVVNVGERDLRQGYAALLENVGERNFALVSANVVRNDTKETVFEPFVIVDARAPEGEATERVGVIGVVRFNPIFRKPGPDGAELAIVHPVEPVKQAAAKLREQGVERIVLLAALHRDDAARIVGQVPEIDFVVGSYGGHFMTKEDRVDDGAWLFYSGNQGKRFGETRVYTEPGGEVSQRTRMHLLSKMYPAEQAMLDYVNSVPFEPDAAAIAAVTSQAQVTGSGPYIGTTACQTCHGAQYDEWSGTAHAQALTTIEEQQGKALPQCQPCHTTAAGLPGGFVSREATPTLASVGCESCHGPGRRHLEDPERPFGKIGLSSCTVCHDPKNSPKFDYYGYVARVNHQASR
jgi:2',3'-cyclic-nucleotide 2'-phosphodiesterase (5'-nucleotidase family)